MAAGQTMRACPPTFIFCSPSFQHGMPSARGATTAPPCLRDESKMVPSGSLPSYSTFTRSVAVGAAPVPSREGM